MTDRDKYKITEQWLYDLESLKARIKNLRIEYTEVEQDLESNAIDYSKDKVSQTYKISSNTEDKGLSLVIITRTINKLENRLKMMENALDSLSETERKIIEMKYLQNEPWYKIAYEVSICERHCRRLRKDAIDKLSNSIAL